MKIGIGLMVLGVGVWTAWITWTKTRRMDPLNVALEANAGSFIENLRLNYDGLYLIEVIAEDTATADDGLSKLGVEWVVLSGGREVSHGTGDDMHSAPAKSRGITRIVGEFNGRAGQNYELRFHFSGGSQELRQLKPRLKVVVSGLARENLDAASVLLFSIMFICEFFGLILVGVGIWGKARVLSFVKTN